MKNRFMYMMLTVVGLFVFSSASLANAAESVVKIGTISLQTVLSQSKVGQAANKAIEAEIDKYAPDLQKEKTDLENMEEEINKKSSVWSEEVRNEKVLSFQQKKSEHEIKQKVAEKKVEQVQKRIMEPILKNIHDIIAEVGKKQGLTLIFENSMQGLQSRTGLLYADKSLEINDIIIKELDARSSK